MYSGIMSLANGGDTPKGTRRRVRPGYVTPTEKLRREVAKATEIARRKALVEAENRRIAQGKKGWESRNSIAGSAKNRTGRSGARLLDQGKNSTWTPKIEKVLKVPVKPINPSKGQGLPPTIFDDLDLLPEEIEEIERKKPAGTKQGRGGKPVAFDPNKTGTGNRVLTQAERLELQRAGKISDATKWVSPDGEFYRDKTAAKGGLTAAVNEQKNALEKGVKIQLRNAAKDATLMEKILKGLEIRFFPVMKDVATEIKKNGGDPKSGYHMPGYLFDETPDLPIKTKLNDWYKFLKNNVGRGRIRPTVVRKAIADIIKVHGVKIGAGLLAGGALATGGVGPLAAAGVALTGGVIDNLLSPVLMGESEMPELEDLPNERKMQYYENLMNQESPLSDPNIDFDRFFEDTPEPGTPMLDVLGIR